MKFKRERYIKYRLALALGIQLPELAKAHPDWAETHARNLYDWLNALGWHWTEQGQYWFRREVKKVQPAKKSRSKTAGIPAGRVVKVRIVAHKANIEAVRASTIRLYQMLDFELLNDSGVRASRFGADLALVYLTFDSHR